MIVNIKIKDFCLRVIDIDRLRQILPVDEFFHVHQTALVVGCGLRRFSCLELMCLHVFIFTYSPIRNYGKPNVANHKNQLGPI